MKPYQKSLALLVLLIGLSIVVLMGINDLKHPTVHSYPCKVLGTGPAMAVYKKPRQIITEEESNPIYDIGFDCQTLGNLFLNSHALLKRSITEGDKATLTYKTYQYMPRHWHIDIDTPHRSE